MKLKLNSHSIVLIALSLLLFSLAQEADVSKRIITITYDGGNRNAPDLRYGPYQYSHPSTEGLIATVSNLTIYGQSAELSAPEGVLISEAEGQREAVFTNGVRVARGRLTAKGEEIAYSEQTGFGVLTEEDNLVNIVVEPKESGEDPAEITAETATFDVDTDISVSQGNVTLLNGSQNAQADEMTFEEDRDLAKLISETGQVKATRKDENDSELIIQADIMRVLTEEDKLLAIGNVVLLDGDITSMGDTVFFDDKASRAEIVGDPAVSVNSAEGITVSGARIEHLTDIDVIELLDDSVPPEFEPLEFMLTSELEEVEETAEDPPVDELEAMEIPEEGLETSDEDIEEAPDEDSEGDPEEVLDEDLEEDSEEGSEEDPDEGSEKDPEEGREEVLDEDLEEDSEEIPNDGSEENSEENS